MMLDLLTVGVMAVGSVIVWRCKPRNAIAVYLWIVLLYPAHWNVDIEGLPTLLPAKVVVLPLILNLVVKAKRDHPFKPHMLDAVIVLLLAGKCLATLTHDSLRGTIADLSHDFTTQTLVYFCLRLGITSRKDVLFLLRTLTYVATVLVFIAVYEALTGNYIYDEIHVMLAGRPAVDWDLLGFPDREARPRFGLYRAAGPFGVPISLGLFFAAMFCLQFCLWTDPAWKRPFRILVPLMLAAGVAATVSSAPLFCFATSSIVLAFYPLRKTAPIAVPLIIALIVAFQFMGPQLGLTAPLTSHLRELAFEPTNADYRLNLVREAFGGGMRDHWCFGYGYDAGIGVENPNPEFNWEHIDIVNIYIAHLVRFGLFGAIPFLFVTLISLLKLVQARLLSRASPDSWRLWCFLAFFLGWQVAFMTVSSIYQVTILLYAFVAVIGVLPDIVSRPDAGEEQKPEAGADRGTHG